MILADPGLEGSKEQLAGCTGGEIGKNRKDVDESSFASGDTSSMHRLGILKRV